MQQPNLRQRSPEWHEFRQKHIGGSDAITCMGDYRYATPYQLYLEKLGLSSPRRITSAMQNGIDNEEPARRAFENLMGISVFPVVRKSRTVEFMMSSLDGIYFFSYTATSSDVVEVKREKNYIRNLIEKERIFWEYVTKEEAPPLTDKDYVYCESNEWKELTEEWKRLSD